MKSIKRIFAVILGLAVLTALIGLAVVKPNSPAVSVLAAVIHTSGGSNLTLLGSETFHNASATGGTLSGGGSK